MCKLNEYGVIRGTIHHDNSVCNNQLWPVCLSSSFGYNSFPRFLFLVKHSLTHGGNPIVFLGLMPVKFVP